jgi:nucleoside-diphosphate-sugar epimerase
MNIIGSGLIASSFSDQDFGRSVILFASGVSNSRETRSSQFDRESKLLQDWLSKSEKLIYFSTCSVEDDNLKSSPYVLHKIQMEKLVLLRPTGIVIRLPQVVGRCDNKYTLTNFLASKIFNNECYDLYYGVLRNLIDITDVVALTRFLLESSDEGNLVSFAMPQYYEVSEIVFILENLLNRVSRHNSKIGLPFKYHKSSFVQSALDNSIISCNDDYLESTLKKYYGEGSDGIVSLGQTENEIERMDKL